MKRPRAFEFLLIGLALGCVALAIAIFFGARLDFGRNVHYAGTSIVPPKFATDATLTDQDGAPAHIFEPDARVTFLFFGYTHCPDECPLALASLGKALRSLPPDVARGVRVVFVTIDPARDDVAAMKRYVSAYDPRFVGLTGTRAQLEPVWSAYGVTVDPQTKDISHGDAIYAIDHTQHVVLIYTPDATPKDLASDAEKLAS